MKTKAENITLKKLTAQKEAALFYLLLILHLLPLLVTTYFVTSDGPCHLYNASVLRDWLLHRDTDLYHRFYLLNHHPDPNWFSHIVLAGLLTILSPIWAEKIFLAGYVIGMLLAVRTLVRYISPANSWLSFLAFPFVYTFIFQQGFFNYSYSLVFMIVCLWYYLRYVSVLTAPVFVTVGMLLSILCFAAHPVGYILMIVLVFGTIFFQYFAQIAAGNLLRRSKLLIFIKKLSLAAVINLIPIIMLLSFIRRKSHEPVIVNNDPFEMKWQSFMHLQSLVSFSERETSFVSFIPYIFLLLLVICIYLKVRSRKLSAYDILVPAAAAAAYYYFHAPNNAMGGSQIAIRVQFLPFFLLIFWFASFSFYRYIKWPVIAIMTVISISLIWLRMPVYTAASELAAEYMSAAGHIAPRSVVLPLTYTHQGKTTDGKKISDRSRYFLHTADYIGTTKPLIMLGNYEGDTGYFPLIWQQNKNPFSYLATNDGIENLPPSVDFNIYKTKSGEDIDYVLLLCFDSEFASHPYTVNLFSQLTAYDLIYTSDHGRIKVYKKKK